MIIRNVLIVSCLILSFCIKSQTVSKIYKIDELVTRISNIDTTYVINFWATWCKPCIAELPAFDSLARINTVKVLLVSLDFKEDIQKKVNPFLLKNNILLECVLLDEVNGNDFINKIDKTWSGAIPATLFKTKKKSVLIEKKLNYGDLKKQLLEVKEAQ